MNPAPPIRVSSLYHFVPVANPSAWRASLQATCDEAGVRGTLLVAREGLNGTIAGLHDAVETVLAVIRALPGCAAVEVKNDEVAAMPFGRMKVRLKREIVTLGIPGLDPAREAGCYVAPQDWNALIGDTGTLVIDVRNGYEVAIGSFAGAVDPGTASFRDFPAWFRANREALLAGRAAPRVAMFCTGGIRCEKATAFLKAEGVENVHHLKGGILRYLETVPPAESLWRGECFVFDGRVAVGPGLAPGTHALCHACRRPVAPADRASPLFEEGVRCPRCAAERGAGQRRRYAERQRQVEIAARRGADHFAGLSTLKD